MPTPRLTFRGLGSALNVSVTPRIGSPGAIGTAASGEGMWGAFIVLTFFRSRNSTRGIDDSQQPVPPARALRDCRRPAGGDRQARRGHKGRPRVPDAARRHRLGQDLHHGERDLPTRAPCAGARAEQDARRAALFRVPRVLPGQRGRVLRLVLRLLPARGLRPGARPLHRKRLLDQRAHRADAPVGHQVADGAARRGDRGHGLGDLRHRRSVRVPRHDPAPAAGRENAAARRAGTAGGDAVRKKRARLPARHLPRARRRDRRVAPRARRARGADLAGGAQGEPPPTLIDYLPSDALMFIDESHVTIGQLGGMYRGDRSRKENLVEYGFRLPSALDNRPLRFDEFEGGVRQTTFVSATPAEYEREKSAQVVEQVVRPTGLVDPQVLVRPASTQVDDLISEIALRVKKNERVLVTTLTKRMAEELTEYLSEHGIKVRYLHSEVDTVERVEIIRDLRLGEFDVLVGINLLREGLDLPEVSLVAILDADKEGFLRSERSLIQTMGRAARHINGTAILYADAMTDSMKRAGGGTQRPRPEHR